MSARLWCRWVLALSVAAVAGCATDKPTPSALETIPSAKLSQRVLWSVSLDRIRFPMTPTARANQLAVAGDDGTVMVLQADSGREVWRAKLDQGISAGVGFDGTLAAVVTRDNALVVLRQGTEVWRAALNTRVATAPLVAGERVFVLGIDRHVQAFDALDGKPIWTLTRPAEALGTLGLIHQGVLAPYQNILIAGQGPRLATIDSVRGTLNQEIPLATPRGTNEVERLADLVGPVVRLGPVVCARAFRAAIGCIQVERGLVNWTRPSNGYEAIDADESLLAASDAVGRVAAWNVRNGDTLWSHERLLHRGLSGAAVTPKAVVFGDAQGYVHWFDRADGSTLQRIALDASPVLGAPLRVGPVLVVVQANGAVHGLSLD